MPSYSLANLLIAFKVVLLDIEETVLKNFSNLSALKSNVNSLPERTTWAVSVETVSYLLPTVYRNVTVLSSGLTE